MVMIILSELSPTKTLFYGSTTIEIENLVANSYLAGNGAVTLEVSTASMTNAQRDALILEFAGETLPLADASSSSPTNNKHFWYPTWLATNAPSLNVANYTTTLTVGGTVNICLRTSTQVCPGGTTPPVAAAGVTVSESALTVTEENTTGDTYTVVLDSEPTASVTIAVGGHASTDVSATPASLTFTTTNWSTAKTVTVTAVNDTNTGNETVSLTHTATSTDSDYDAITIDGVTVTVEDNDTAKVTGVILRPGDGELVVEWLPVPNATGYQVQWKSGGQGYNNNSRRAVIGSGSTASHTIPSLTNGTTYTVRVRATRSGANPGRIFGRGDGRAGGSGGGGRDGVGRRR